MKKIDIFVGGKWQLGRGHEMHSRFPGDQHIVATLNSASLDDVEEAVLAADNAWRDPAWRYMPAHQRAAILLKVSALIEERAEELVRLQTLDNGKPWAEARGLVMSAAATARYFAAVCEVSGGELPPRRQPDMMTLSTYQPLGVIAAITPWNSPIASDMQKIAPAIAAGNAVILKPAEATPLISLKLAELFEEAGLPSGLLSVLPGKGSVVGDALVRHPLVRKISFTGGTNTGRQLAHIAADKLITTSLELGGKSPTIVLEDADLDLAAHGVCYGIFSSMGQACIAGSRLFVSRAIYQPFLEKLTALTQQLIIGDPRQERVHVGPLISPAHRESVMRYVAQAITEGGSIRLGGTIPQDPHLQEGNYFLPTIIEGLNNQASVCQEEIFGPVLVVIPFDNEAELIEEANDSLYGLAAGIWTKDYTRAFKLADALDVGTVWINTYKVFSISTPFGGFKESGLGREKGLESLKAYMQQKSIFLALNPQPNRWCE
ncbi:aldehyde dehydrogenase [Providencia vermicola]|uniref:aldehyde dehydrogenase n=1 Tax=Providencia TaxID=586 RepID=UPI0012B5B735|nr:MULTISPECIES: aldehyde dehydrogenase [Providencia]ELR5143405.1 aldehyde dehydrogenase [Providencia stuartii]MTB42059.1 aldehyde dehydrogenase family protein [Providencia sp. wls1949]MTC06669.1 aldehyde dehydrogenase family protein [Providencia sp. wls1948]QIC16412.1 aldehyde dehydrogenase [Providencia vermicola]WER20831.1 aldehyde dehydrogenase [Providencia stuartii]